MLLTGEQQQLLLRLARESIYTALTERRMPTPPEVDEGLRQPLGVFVTLTRDGNLRGCIGFPEPVYPLCEAVMQGGVAAALQDPRFPPVTLSELEHLSIEISVLSPLSPIVPDAVVVGTHGLVIEKGSARGLLLPQVPVEWGWDRTAYLTNLCRKAGLPIDAWRSGAKLFGFTAEVFAENNRPDQPCEYTPAELQ